MKINNRLKKCAAAIFAVVTVIFCLVSASAADIPAGKVGKMVILGDAVSYGAGLDDRAGKCYGALAASSLGLGEGGYINLAEDALTSEALAAALISGDVQVSGADLVVVSVGGEDILVTLRRAFAAAVADGISYGELTERVKDGEFVRKLNAAVDYQALLNSAAKYAVNIENIISALRRQNPDVRIVFLTLYDPLGGISDLSSIANIYASTLELMNRELETAVSGKGCYLLDVAEVFSDRAAELTNITSLTVTPNEAGHRLIAELLRDLAATLPEYSSAENEDTVFHDPDETAAPDESSPEDSKNSPLDVTFREKKSGMIFYIVGAVVIGALGVVVGVVAAVRREKNRK